MANILSFHEWLGALLVDAHTCDHESRGQAIAPYSLKYFYDLGTEPSVAGILSSISGLQKLQQAVDAIPAKRKSA